jgi:hypothetical protein
VCKAVDELNIDFLLLVKGDETKKKVYATQELVDVRER